VNNGTRTVRAAALTSTAAALLASGILAASAPASAATTALISITKLSTNYGSTAGGTTVLITGTGFNRVNPDYRGSVMFGPKSAASYMVLSDTTISATAPSGLGTGMQVSVNDGQHTTGNTTSDDWTYIDPVKVAVPANTELSAAGGTVVRLTLAGAGSIGATSSAFTSNKVTATVDGVPAKSLTWVDATHLDITAPAGIATQTGSKVPVNVFIRGVAGTADTTNARYDAVVTKLSATSGSTAGTTGTTSKPALTITGVGLTNAAGWMFGSKRGACTATSGKGDTTWTCVSIPANTAGPVSVLPVFYNGTRAGITPGATYTYGNL
jgi:hypothetical protein